MPKKHMFCDQCNETTLHKQNVFGRIYWHCKVCKTERRFVRSKGNWVEEMKEKRKLETRLNEKKRKQQERLNRKL